MLTETKKKLIQQIIKTDEDEYSIQVLTMLKDFKCEFCGDTPFRKVFSDPSLGTDLCGYHNQIVDKLREMGLENHELRIHMPELERIQPRK